MKSLAEREAMPRAGKPHYVLNWNTRTGAVEGHHLYATGEEPRPGDITHQQGVFLFRKGRTVRLHDVLPEDMKRDFDPDDAVDEPPTSTSLEQPHDGSTTVPALIGFMAENRVRAENKKAEKAQKKAENSKRRAEAAARSSVSSKLSSYQRAIRDGNRRRFIELKHERDAEVHDTRANGVFWPGGEIAGRYYPPFTEYFGPGVTRSDLHPMIAYFVSTLPAQIRVGADKTFVEPHWSKQQGLLYPYVEGDARFCRWIFKDLDGAIFRSPEDFVNALAEILTLDDRFKDERIAKNMVPNLITGHMHEDGTFEGGHLIWLLEPGARVWTDRPRKILDENNNLVDAGDPRCRKEPIAKLGKVRASLCKLLLELGADPGQTNWRKLKAPTSPFITVIVANEENLFELDDFTKIKNYPLHANMNAMLRDAALMRGEKEGLSETLSMARWRKTKDITSAVALTGRKSFDNRFTLAQAESIRTGNPHALATYIEAEVRKHVAMEPDLVEWDGPGLDWLIKRMAVFAAKIYMKPKQRKTKRQPIRGRDRTHKVVIAEVDATLSVEEQAEAKRQAEKRATDGGYTVVIHEVDPTAPIKERAEAERTAKKDAIKLRRQEAGRCSGAQHGDRKYYGFKKNVYTWVELEGNKADWNVFRKEGLWSCTENTARKYWKRALEELFPETQIGV